jgi:hypothetical protein
MLDRKMIGEMAKWLVLLIWLKCLAKIMIWP